MTTTNTLARRTIPFTDRDGLRKLAMYQLEKHGDETVVSLSFSATPSESAHRRYLSSMPSATSFAKGSQN